MTLKNQVQLISYPDSLGQNLLELHYVLRRYLTRAVGGIHILPFYPSSADRGFAPITYEEVDPAFGTWVDVEHIGEIRQTIDGLYEKGSNVKKIYSGPEYQNLDIYQVNCTYYSALECNDDAYLAARAIQFFAPGIPQVYYVGLLAGENDVALVERTLSGRNINRHNYDLDEIETAIQKPVVERLLHLMEFRNTHPAFAGAFRVEETPDDRLALAWQDGGHHATAHVDLNSYRVEIDCTDPFSGKRRRWVA
jgi:sucrose phosphorylase